MYKIIKEDHGYIDFFGTLVRETDYNNAFFAVLFVLIMSATLLKNPYYRIFSITSIAILVLLF